MAIDASIPLLGAGQSNIVDVPGIMQKTMQSYDAMKAIPINAQQRELGAQANNEAFDRQKQQNTRQDSLQKANTLLGYAKQVKGVPMAQRRTFIDTIDKEMMSGLGVDPEALDKLQLDDASLDTSIAQLEGALSSASQEQEQAAPVSIQERQANIAALNGGLDESGRLKPRDQLSAQQEAAAVNLGLLSRAATAASEFGDREQAKLDAQLNTRPEIESAVTTAKAEAGDVQDYIKQATPKLAAIRKNIQNYDDVITAIDDGASTGFIQSKLPSFSAASTDLDNIRGKLGLDVVGASTFGALSESELAFALDVALPDTKNPKELKAWVTRKRDAQEAALKDIRDSVAFLNDGNTMADLIAEGGRRAESKASSTQQDAAPSASVRVYNMETGEFE